MGITHLSGLEVAGVPTMGMSGLPLTIGTVFFCDYVNGSDGNIGSADAPLKTLYGAQFKMTAGKNDVAVIVGDGSTTATQRLSLANAQVLTPAATAGTLVWAKAACHIVGMAAPTMVAARARIAPPSGTYTAATFGSGNFITVTAAGCIFANFSVFCGFSTGGLNSIAWTDSGSRNYYNNVNIGGIGDAASGADTGARCLKISGGGENTFVNCTIGLDTVDRSVANASLEFAGGTARNTFIECVFPMRATNAGVLSILGTGAACMDRYQRFMRCAFINAMASGATAQTVIASMTNAAPGGLLFFDQCTFIGNSSTNWGDTNALAVSYINMSAVSASGGGIGTNPS